MRRRGAAPFHLGDSTDMAEAADQRFTGTTAVQDAHAFEPGALQAWFARHVEHGAGPLRIAQFKGGQSNPTFLVETDRRRYVVRRKPPGALLPSAHAVDREFRVMRALSGSGVPVPEVLALCEDDSVLGSAFYVMAYVDGRVLWDPRLPGLPPAQRAQLYGEMNRVIAELHDVDVQAAGLQDFGRPGHYVMRQLGRWSAQYRASRTEDIEAMDRLMDWLPQHAPASARSAVVHGDYRLDNLVFAHDAPRLLAVLDWELSTIGDPIADFAYHCMAWHLAPPLRGLGDLAGSDLARLGLPSQAAYLASYCARRGLPPVSPAEWGFYMAFNLFRAAAIAQGIMARAVQGNAASAHALEAGRQARQLAELGWALARREGAAH